MPRATGQPALKKSFLRGLTRSKLQALAKTYDIKANGKNHVIIRSLLANKALKKENVAESSISLQFSSTTEARITEDVPVLKNIPGVKTVTSQHVIEVRNPLPVADMKEEQKSLQDLVRNLQRLNDETCSILDKRTESLKKMIWTRQVVQQLCIDHEWDRTAGMLQEVWSRYCEERLELDISV